MCKLEDLGERVKDQMPRDFDPGLHFAIIQKISTCTI